MISHSELANMFWRRTENSIILYAPWSRRWLIWRSAPSWLWIDRQENNKNSKLDIRILSFFVYSWHCFLNSWITPPVSKFCPRSCSRWSKLLKLLLIFGPKRRQMYTLILFFSQLICFNGAISENFEICRENGGAGNREEFPIDRNCM